MNRPISRRRLLLMAGAGIVAAGVPFLSRTFEPEAREAGPEATPDELLAALEDREDARLIGAAWLGSGAVATPEALAATLSSRLRRHGWRPGAGVERLRTALNDTIRADYGAGDMVGIQGWQLARTGAELCALAALT